MRVGWLKRWAGTAAAAYAGSLAALVAAILLRWVLDPLLGGSHALVTLFAAVAFAVWLSGYRAAVAVALLGYGACAYLFLEPRGGLGLDTSGQLAGLAAYLLTCVLLIGFGEAAKRGRANQLSASRLMASIVESSDVPIISKSIDGFIQSWNPAAERLFGYSANDAIGRHISLVIPPDRIAEEDEILATLQAGERVEQLETERMRSDGRLVLVSLTVSPITDEAGNVIGASKIVRDVTREREAEADREKFVTLVENSTDFIGICDVEGKPIFVNRAGLEMVGLDDIEEARRRRVWDFFFPEDQPRIQNELFPRVQEEGHGEVEIRFRHFETGEALWMAYKVIALRDDAGKTVAFATVSQDVTERRELEHELRRLAADLSRADRHKDEFLATLAHELRGPLAPLGNVLEVWKRTDDAEMLRRARKTMERQLGQIVRLVDDLLDLNRISHDLLELRRSRVELATVLQQAVEASQPLARSLGHELRLMLPAEPLRLEADPARLAQVFGNLLSNACKYTEPGGVISVTASREGSEVVAVVKDTGTGIPADEIDSIFEMFTQADRSLRQAQDGLGIGLTLVQRLVEMHGGTVEAKSPGPGRGSEFVVRLPALSDEPSAVRPAPVAAREALPSRRILVVDDNRDSADSLAMLLALHGHETETAHDGAAAIEGIARRRPDVVLLDIGLPSLSGYDVCRRVRQESWGDDVVIIAVTGWGQEEDRRRSEEAGFDGHLVKPVDFEQLFELIRGNDRLR